MIKRKAILLKIVGYAFLFIGIAGGLASIGIALNGEFFIWLICVASFCGIGWISVLSSKNIKQKISDTPELSQEIQQAMTEKKSTIENKKSQFVVYVHKLRNFLHSIWIRTTAIENIYLKFLLTVIAISLVVIAIELNNRNFYGAVEIINGSIRVDGTVDVTGEMNTYEQNTIGRNY